MAGGGSGLGGKFVCSAFGGGLGFGGVGDIAGLEGNGGLLVKVCDKVGLGAIGGGEVGLVPKTGTDSSKSVSIGGLLGGTGTDLT